MSTAPRGFPAVYLKIGELEKEIAETKKRLPAHSIKPPVMMDLMALEDEYHAILQQIERLKQTDSDASRPV